MSVSWLKRSGIKRDHGENDRHVLEMERRLGQHGLAGQQRLVDVPGDSDRPLVMEVAAVREGHKETGVGNALHPREKPLRADRSRAPRTLPARRMNDRAGPSDLARSSWSRMIFPCETPVFLDFSSSHPARSLSRRTVIV